MQEAAGEAALVVAPEVAVIVIPAQLLAGGGPLVAGQGQCEDHLGGVGLAAGHRDQGALGPGQGHQGQEAEQGEHGHWSPGGEHGLRLHQAVAVMQCAVLLSRLMALT